MMKLSEWILNEVNYGNSSPYSISQQFAQLEEESEKWKSVANEAMDIVVSWQIDWEALANDPKYKPEYNKSTVDLKSRIDILLTREKE